MENSSNHIILFEKSEKIELDLIKNKKALHILRAINHPLRLEILKFIDSKNNVTVTEIYQHLKIDQAIASQNLAVLRRAGFVTTKKESKYVYYSLSLNYFKHFTKIIQEMFS